MAADATLVQGQFRAKQHYDMGLAAARNRASKMIRDIKPPKKKEEEVATTPKPPQVKQVPQVKTITPEQVDPNKTTELKNPVEKDPVVQANENKANKNAKKGEGLTNNDKDLIREINEENQDQFYQAVVNGDNKEIEHLKDAANKRSDDMNAFNETLLQLNEDFLNRGDHTQYGYGGAFTNAPQEEQDWVMGIINAGEDGVKLMDIDGELRIEGPPNADGSISYFTEPELRDYLSQYEMDNTTFNEIHGLAQQYYKQGEDDFGTKGDEIQGSFNFDNVNRSVQSLVGRGNLRSMVFDKSFGNSSYYDDIINSNDLKNIKYSDLNLDPPEGEEGGTITSDDNINEDLKIQIMDKLLSDKRYEDSLRKSLSNYFTGHLERNYYAEYMKSKIQRPYEGAPGMIETKHMPTRVGYTFTEKPKIG